MRPISILAMLPLMACNADTTSPAEDCDGVVTEWTEPVIDGDVTFTCTTQYTGDLRISGGHLMFDPCARLELGGSSRIFVEDGGILEVVGTEDCPATITSMSSSPAAGDWRFIEIEATADGATRFEHAVVEYGGSDGNGGISGQGVFDLVDTTIRGMEGIGISTWMGRLVAFDRVHFDGIQEHPIAVHINDVSVIEDITVDNAGDPAILVSDREPMTTDQTWDVEEVPYELQNTTNIQADLDLEAGTTVRLQPATRLLIAEGGTVDLLGTEDAPVLIESAAERPFAGDWRYISFDTTSDSSLWSHATVRHGGSDGLGAVYIETDNRVSFDNVTFEDNLDCDVGLATYGVAEPSATSSPYALCD